MDLEHEVSCLKQDASFLKEQNKLLMKSYVSLTADFVSLRGLLLDVASEAGIDTDNILDTADANRTKKMLELLASIKESYPGAYDDL
jgi:hypothetical protein